MSAISASSTAPVSVDEYCTPHVVNWYVHRDKQVSKELKRLWKGGPNEDDKEYTIDQKIHHRVNVLFRNLENFGPNRDEFNKFRYDTKNDFYHAHVWDGKISYLVMWEADHDKKVINIVRLGTHENFIFKRHKQHKKEEAVKEIEKLREVDKKYKANRLFHKQQNSHYVKKGYKDSSHKRSGSKKAQC